MRNVIAYEKVKGNKYIKKIKPNEYFINKDKEIEMEKILKTMTLRLFRKQNLTVEKEVPSTD